MGTDADTIITDTTTTTNTHVDPADKPVWGAANFGKVINRAEAQVYHLLEQKRLDADKSGNLWVSTPRRLLAPFQNRSQQD